MYEPFKKVFKMTSSIVNKTTHAACVHTLHTELASAKTVLKHAQERKFFTVWLQSCIKPTICHIRGTVYTLHNDTNAVLDWTKLEVFWLVAAS